jgi:hypothetical protein
MFVMNGFVPSPILALVPVFLESIYHTVQRFEAVL